MKAMQVALTYFLVTLIFLDYSRPMHQYVYRLRNIYADEAQVSNAAAAARPAAAECCCCSAVELLNNYAIYSK